MKKKMRRPEELQLASDETCSFWSFNDRSCHNKSQLHKP